MQLHKYIFLGLSLLFLLPACEEAIFDPVVRIGGPMSLSSGAEGSTVTVTEDNLQSVFTTFEWSAADFGFPAAVTYTLQLDEAGNNFSDPVNLKVTTETTARDITMQRINSFALARELPGGEAAPLEFRVIAKVNDDVETITSDVITINVAPLEIQLEIPVLQVPGSYQGWNEKDANTVIYSRKNDGFYDGYLYIGDDNAEYKYTQGFSWDTNWGDTGADGTLEPNGDNIQTGAGGMYYLTSDLNALTHSRELRNWGIIGTATPGGWGSDTDMIWDAARGVLTITMDMPAESVFKFRANDDWPVNLGDDGLDGSLEQDGADIPITEAGNYTIDLILTEPEFTYTVTKN